MVRDGPRAALLQSLDAARLGTTLHHVTAVEQRRIVGEEEWGSVESFAIVRNPFDWAVSQFFYNLEAHCGPEQRQGIAVFRCPPQNATTAARTRDYFNEWLGVLDLWADIRNRPFVDGNLVSRVGANATSQLSWLQDETGRVIVKHVIRLEDRGSFREFSTPGRFLGRLCSGDFGAAPNNEEEEEEEEAPHVKKSHHLQRSLYYVGLGCEIVARRFRSDFLAFNYDPRNCSGIGDGKPFPL